MKLYAVHYNSLGVELERVPVRVRDADDDSAELSEAMHDAIYGWTLAVGDTIKIIEVAKEPRRVDFFHATDLRRFGSKS